MIQIEQILVNIRNLPTLSESVSRLSRLIRDESATPTDFERIIRPDPALTANLLRLANSAYFGFRHEITSVRQAVSLMGTKRIFELALSGAFSQVIPSYLPGYGIEASQFWLHSIAAAVFSERIAALKNIELPDLVFTAGLLHDIGKLVMGPFLSGEQDRFVEALHNGQKSFLEIERDVLGTDHTEVGALIAQIWNLPQGIEMAVRWHHHPEDAPPDADRNLLDLVHMANNMAHLLGFGSDVGGLRRHIEQSTLDRLKLTGDMMDHLIADTFLEIEELGRVVFSEE